MSNVEHNQVGGYRNKSAKEQNDCEDKRELVTTLTRAPPYTCEFCKCAPCLFFEYFQECGELISCLLKCERTSMKEAISKLSRYYYKAINGEHAIERLNYSEALPFCINAEIVALVRPGNFEIYEHNPFRIWTKNGGYEKRKEIACEICNSRPCRYEENYDGVRKMTVEDYWYELSKKEKIYKQRNYFHWKMHGKALGKNQKFGDRLPFCVMAEIENGQDDTNCRFRILSRNPMVTWGHIEEGSDTLM